jgi:signal transduction histidine kinase
MGFITGFVVYIATFIRLLAFSVDDAPQGPIALVLAVFGFFLVTEPWIKKRLAWYPAVYLVIQSALVTWALLIPPNYDFLPILFITLTLTAVMSFGYPAGYFWIAFFILALVYPILDTWEGSIEGYIMIVVYAGLYLLTGSFANKLRKVEISRKENERLLEKLQNTHRELEEYKAQIEDHAAARTRNQMAQELHDSVTQTIFTVSLAAQSAALKYKKEPSSAREQIDRMVELAGDASEEITDLVSLFRPRSVITDGLPSALKFLAHERSKRDHLNVDVTVSGNRVLPEDTSLGLYRIAQEALNNVTRHAGSDQAEIRLDFNCFPAFLEIIDQGKGFDPAADLSRSGHFGLIGMRDRAIEIGWKLTVESHPGGGTHIRIEETMS